MVPDHSAFCRTVLSVILASPQASTREGRAGNGVNAHAGLVLVPVAPKTLDDTMSSPAVWDSSVLANWPNPTDRLKA